MAHMSEVSSSRFNASRHFQSLIHAQMRRMRLVPQGVDDECFHAFDLLRNFHGHFAAIAQIRDKLPALPSKQITVDDGIPMRDRQRRDLGFTEKKWARNDVRFGFEIARKRIKRFESELKDPLQILHRVGRGVNWHEAALISEPPQVVEAHDMVGM